MSSNMTPEQEKLLREFEAMLNDTFEGEEEECEDFGTYFPPDLDLEYPDDPPPIPEKVEEKKCLHKKKKFVKISMNLQYWYCPECKEEVEK